MWWYAMLADLVVVIHFAYVSYVVVGLLLIIAGIVRRWQWIRNLWFRVSHLLLIAIVAGESIFGIWCPLTDWEFNLRIWAGQKPYQGTFISELMNKIFWIKLPESVYTTIYVSVALFVLSTFWLCRRDSDGKRRWANREPARRSLNLVHKLPIRRDRDVGGPDQFALH